MNFIAMRNVTAWTPGLNWIVAGGALGDFEIFNAGLGAGGRVDGGGGGEGEEGEGRVGGEAPPDFGLVIGGVKKSMGGGVVEGVEGGGMGVGD
jgi:hypothetical protein